MSQRDPLNALLPQMDDIDGRAAAMPLRCAWCEAERPDDEDDCPHCGRPRFHHKSTPEEFWERMRRLGNV